MQELAEREIRDEKIRQQKEKYEDEYNRERAEIEEKDRKAQWTHEEDCQRQKIREGKQADVPEKHRDELRQKPIYKRDKTRDLLLHKPQKNSLNDFFKKNVIIISINTCLL